MKNTVQTPLPSPCVGVCQLDNERQYCKGCLRTPKEISDWPISNNVGRLEILGRLQERRTALGIVRLKPSQRKRNNRRRTT